MPRRTVGEFGVAYARTDDPQPWFDDHDARVCPVYHVLRGLAEAAGSPRLATSLSDGAAAQAVACQAAGAGLVVWLANWTGAPQSVALEGLAGRRSRIGRLDLDCFTTLTADPDALGMLAADGEVGGVELGPYAVLRLQIAR